MCDWYDEFLTAFAENDRDGVLSMLHRLPNIPDAVNRLNEPSVGGPIVLTACQKGYPEVLEFLSYSAVDYTNTGTEESPIQVACEYKQESVVEWYLESGVPILPGRIKPWEEQSPFYIASKNGCHGIVQKLIGADPSLIKDDKVRQCLLYAACLSGDITTVKMWLSPSIDINHPLQLVKKLTDCETLTPLHAACSGGHVGLINFLRENYDNLMFTSNVCNTYPEAVGEVMKTFIVPVKSQSQDELFTMSTGHFQHKNLQYLHNSWFSSYCVTLVELDASHNILTELPSCLPWKLQNLKILNVSHNNIKSLDFSDDGESCTTLSLEEFNLSHNNLERVCRELFEIKTLVNLNLSNNKLMHLSKSLMHQTDPEEDPNSILKRRSNIQERHWFCSKLCRLDVSYNLLVMLPVEIQACTELTHINVSHNRLTTFPQPWYCPLEIIDLSNNQLERFPVSTELFWSSSLRYLDISNNLLHEINEGIVKLSILTDLIAYNNKIERLPVPEAWECGHLHNLNLKHNKLGVIVESPVKKPSLLYIRKRSTSSNEDTPQLQFPASLAHCLKELRLADNNLDCVPQSVCSLTALEILDLSNNPLIKVIPQEMGYLKNLGVFKLKGVTPTNLPASLLQDNGCKTKEIISELLERLRDCKPYNKIKAVVLGKKDKGKTTLVNILAGKKAQRLETKSIVRKEISLSKKTFAVWKDTEIKLNVWDIAGDDAYTQIHHSVFTPLTLYILVWDFWSITDELDKIAKWINNIQAKSTTNKIVLVGTFIDKLGTLKPEMIETVNEKLTAKFGNEQTPRLCPVSCINNDGIDDLKVTLYDTALSMRLSIRGRPPLIGRKVPRSYRLLEKRIAEEQKRLEDENKPLYLTQSEFMDVIESIPEKENDLQSVEETAAVTKFLEEIGAILHFADQLGALDTLYFLDPAWLCDILVHILICPEGKKLLKQERGKIKRSAAEKLYEGCAQFPSEFVKQYIELLERFEIATCISQTERLFFPCQLPIEPPIIETAYHDTGVVIVRRLYKMSECPSGFWMRLITRMMMRVEQFEKKNWYFKPSPQSMRLMTIRRSHQRSTSVNRHQSFHGLQINKPKQTYSREMIHVSHEDGSFCVEPVAFTAGDLQKGVLVTEESRTANFAMMGVIVDEIEDIVQDFYPGLLELDSVTMGYHMERYALCSTCYQGLPLPNNITHFTMEHCARMLVSEASITCPLGIKQDLNDLVPDLLLKEIPAKFFLDISKLSLDECKENCLGSGVTGSVFKATYDGVSVAIKIYRSDIRNATKIKSSANSSNSDSGTATLSTQGSAAGDGEEKIYANLDDAMKIKCLDEAESIKSLKAIKEMRQEVNITSRLQHPCIISLIGIAFRPKLMMALELAPLGSLRDILDKELQGRPVYNRYKNKDELFPPLFEKEVIFKFVYQIAKGLEYLHSNGIIYKDLKSDNILTISTDLKSPVNLKLSDYGISKFSWAGRSVGLVGTPGYQAPEILDGKPYDEKVDIFSLSMVIYEIWTGKRPYAECENLAQITKAMKVEGRRPNIKDIRILTKFSYMENMMSSCWENMAVSRPAATTIASKHCMQNVQFLAQTWAVESPGNQPFSSSCVLGTTETGGKPVLCVWDPVDTVCSLTILDPEWLTTPVKRVQYDTPPVICMATAGKHIWVGHSTGAVIYSPGAGTLESVGTYQLDAPPVQILSILNTKGHGHVNSYKVYVALSQGVLLQFKTQKMSHGGEALLRRKSVKQISGYAIPTSIVLRSKSLYCMAHATSTDQLWIGCEGYIDIVSCDDFKVNADHRINMTILLRLHNLCSQFHISQMVNYGSQMFCLLKDSPYILEFNTETYMCQTVLTLDMKHIYSKVVSKETDFSAADHEAYHGVTTADYMCDRDDSNDSNSDTEFNDSGETPPKVPPRKDRPPPIPAKPIAKKAQRVLGISDPTHSLIERSTKSPPVPPKRPVTVTAPVIEITPPIGEVTAPPRPPKSHTIDNQGRRQLAPSLDRNTSFSLPNMQRHTDFAVYVTSMIIVKDTLWVGRSCGDISVVSVSRNSSTDYGKVIANLYDVNKNKRDAKTVDAVKLVNTGKYVAAGYHLEGESVSETALAFWEGYGAADIERINKYFTDIINIEKSLARSSQLGNVCSQDVGEF